MIEWSKIDVDFKVFSDTPPGKDPDQHSPTLRRYHQVLWSKPLPRGQEFSLDLSKPRLLYHNSSLGEFKLSSDSIGHTYRDVKKMSHITSQVSRDFVNHAWNHLSTIGGYIIFPANQINRKPTINAARGINHQIQDRFDLTLECIRLFYKNKKSPLWETFCRYESWFKLFSDFRGFVDHFLLQDTVSPDYKYIDFWHPFTEFNYTPLPSDAISYEVYINKVSDFVSLRNLRISKLSF